MSHPIVITGAGLISCLGLSRDQTWSAVRASRCGMGPMAALESPAPPGSTGGQAPDLAAEEAGEPREARYLRHALDAALADAGLQKERPYSPERCGVVMGTTLHGMRGAGRFLRSGRYEQLSDFLASSTLRSAAAGRGLEGMGATVCSACSSSLGSIALAMTLLRNQQLDLVIAGGYDTISEYVYGGFNSLRLVAPGPLRPFARGREGMKLAEGYAVVVLERADDALARGAKPLATILGYGESADAHHLTQPHPQGRGAARALSAAIEMAGLAPQNIGLISAHATGTPDNDAAEFAAMSHVFGAHLSSVPVVAFKSHLGHTLGSAGAAELILSAMALRDQMAPACANLRSEEIEFPGLYVATGCSRSAPLRATLTTSLGFGGANTAMVLGPPPSPTQPPPLARGRQGSTLGASPAQEVLVTGVGAIAPGAVGNEAFAKLIGGAGSERVARDTGAVPDADLSGLLNARRVRRMSDYVKLTLAATMLALNDAGITDTATFADGCPAILGSTHGSSNYSETYYRQIVQEGLAGANPMLFAEGVPNAAAAHLSLMLSLTGACQTVIGSRTAGLDALRLATARIAGGGWSRAIVSAGEEYSILVNEAYRSWGLYAGEEASAPFQSQGGFATGAAAVTLVLESRQSAQARGARPRGVVQATAAGMSPLPDFPRRAARVIAELGNPRAVLSSANGTWLDGVEAAGLRRAARAGPLTVSSISGYLAECFSAGPLAGIAAALLNGRLPALQGPGPGGLTHSSRGEPLADTFAALCTDYTGLVSGARIGILARG